MLYQQFRLSHNESCDFKKDEIKYLFLKTSHLETGFCDFLSSQEINGLSFLEIYSDNWTNNYDFLKG